MTSPTPPKNGFALILCLIFISAISVVLPALVKLSQLQTQENLFFFKTTQLTLLAQSGLPLAKQQWATLPNFREPVSLTTILTNSSRTKALTTPAGNILYLAKSPSAVYSVGGSQSASISAQSALMYRCNYVLDHSGNPVWTTQEKLN